MKKAHPLPTLFLALFAVAPWALPQAPLWQLSETSAHGLQGAPQPGFDKVFAFTGENGMALNPAPVFPAAFTLEAIFKLERPLKNDTWTLLGSQGNLLLSVNVYERGAAKVVLTTWPNGKECGVKTREWLEYGRWYHVTISADTATGDGAFYFNAVALTPDKFQDRKYPEGPLAPATRPFAVGTRFRGEVALLAVSPGRKPEAEIRQVYENYKTILGPQNSLFPSANVPAAEERPVILPPGQKQALVPTFHACGFYALGADGAPVLRFQKKGGPWREAYPPVYDPEGGMFRGSLVNLEENTEYLTEFTLPSGEKITGGFRTWSSVVPVAKTIRLADLLSRGRLEFRERGAEGAWIRIDGSGVTVAPEDKNLPAAVFLEGAAYVILENVTVRGGANHAVELRGCDQIRILNGDFAGWGRVGKSDPSAGGKYRDDRGSIINNDAAVFINQSANTVIERCWAHDPAGHSNPWDPAHPLGFAATHPAGPNAVFVRALGGTVIRWNDFTGSDGHRWNDGIEGWNNGGPMGSFYRDSDIYGNFLAFGQDDGIELDGGQMNVRFFGNKVEGFLCGVSVAPCVLGPSYIFGNTVVNLADQNGWMNTMVKPGGGNTYSKGRSFIFHNTLVSPGRGIGGAGFGAEKDNNGFHITSRNNVIYSLDKKNTLLDSLKWEENDFDHDLYQGGALVARSGSETSGLNATPQFVNQSAGDLRLAPGSPGLGKALALPNFSDGYPTANPGAYLSGDPLTPVRPMPLRASAMQLNFTALAEKSLPPPQNISVRAQGVAGDWHQKFRILKNANLPWLSVSPEGGDFIGDKPVSFTITFQPGQAPRPEYRGCFLIKLENGFSLPITAYGSYIDRRGEVTLGSAAVEKVEAPYRRIPEAGATGGTCLYLDSAEGQYTSASNRVSLDFPFNTPVSGKWFFSARLKSEMPVSLHDSCYVSLDGGPLVRIDLSSTESWSWAPLKDFSLEAGPHTLRIHPRETGLFWDQITVARAWVKN